MEIPEGVTTLAQYAFGGCKNLKKITVPDSIKELGVHSFDLGVSGSYTGDAKFYIKSDRVRKLLKNVTVLEENIILNNDNYFTDKNGFQVDKKSGMLTGYIGNNAQIKIPSEIQGIKITSIGDQAFLFSFDIIDVTSVEIPEGVTSIGKEAFLTCPELKTIKIPSTVTSIGENAFWNCDKLENTIIPESVTSIGKKAFNSIDGTDSTVYVQSERVKQLLINSGKNASKIVLNGQSSGEAPVKSNSNYEFDKATGTITKYIGSDKEVVIPDEIDGVKVKHIGEWAFYENGIITSVKIPYGVEDIQRAAFFRCPVLKDITIPDSVTQIGSNALYGCPLLKTITIPDSVTSIDRSVEALGYNAYFDSIYVQSERVKQLLIDHGIYESKIIVKGQSSNDKIIDKYGLEFDKKTQTIVGYKEAASQTNVQVAGKIDGVKVLNIGERVFENKVNLERVLIEDGVTSIGEYAFFGCKNLEKVTIPDSVITMGKKTFEYCDNAKFYVQSERVKKLLLNACVKESQIVLNDQTSNNSTSVDKYGLEFDKKTQTIVGYKEAASQTDVQVAGKIDGVKVLNIGERVFENKIKLERVLIEDGVTSIGEYAFFGCKNLEKVTIPDSVITMGGKTFEYCDNAKFYVQSERVKKLLLNACVKESQIVLNNQTSNNSTSINANTTGGNKDSNVTTNASTTSDKNDAKVTNIQVNNTNATNTNGKLSVQVNRNNDNLHWQYSNGVWKLFKGNVIQKGWQIDNGCWYLLSPNGTMLTGWQKDRGNWYLLSPTNGSMLTGWQKTGNAWYYIYPDGHMASNTIIDGYRVGSNGAWRL